MRIAIVDDVREDADRLEEYLHRYQEESGILCECTRYSSAVAFLSGSQPVFDLVIMDIDMPGLNGVDAAKRLRESGDNVVLMFVTNMPQYALAGYAVDAVDYVLKPVAYADFALKLRKAERYIKQNQSAQIPLNTADGMVLIPSAEVLYVESVRHYLIYHTQSGEYRVRGTLSEAEQSLPTSGFARCNNSFLVNLRHVRGIDRQDVLVGNQQVKISRGMRMSFMDRFSRYLGGITP